MNKLLKEHDITFVFITHDLAIAKWMSDRIAVMYLGNIIEIGRKEDVISNALHPYTKTLLSALPIPDPTKKREHVHITGEATPAVSSDSCPFHPRCPYAMKMCSRKKPELRETRKDHYVACFLEYPL